MGDLSRRLKVGRNAAPLALVAGLLTIFYATLNPFNFRFRHLSLSNYLARFTFGPSAPFDFSRNILLFVPLGFFLGVILDQRGWSKKRVRIVVFFSGLLLTITVESLQQFIPGRQPSVLDLIANTLGAVAGLVFFRLWQNRHTAIDWIRSAITDPPKILAAMGAYVLFLLLVGTSLASSARVYSWDMRYHLMLGNEWTGDRPWVGSIRDLVIFNTALDIDGARQMLKSPELALSSSDGLQAYYPLTSGSPYSDLAGKQPDLMWQTGGERRNDEVGVQVDDHQWLATGTPVSALFEEFEETSQFSIGLSASTDSVEQFGPARLLSMSEDPFFRNLMIGQEKKDLIFRFRSPLTGDNGVTPQFLFPDFFPSSNPSDFVVIYDGLAIKLVEAHSSRVPSIELVPGVAFYVWLQDLFTTQQGALSQIIAGEFYNWSYRLLFYSVVFLPLGILLALPAISTWPIKHRQILIVCCLLVVPCLLELVLVARSGQNVRMLNIVTNGVVIAVITWIVVPAVGQFFGLLRRARSPKSTDSG